VKALLLAIVLTAAATSPPLTLSATVAPSRAAPLVAVTIGISVTNRGRVPVTLEFPTPDLFSIEIRDTHGTVLYDSRSGHKPIPVRRKMTFPVGTTKLALFDWNGLSDARRALAAGEYDVHVEMRSESMGLVADMPLVLEAPVPIAGVLAAPSPKAATIEGNAERFGMRTFLRDDTGTIALSGPLGLRPQGRFVVRGILQILGDQRTFVIDRFAPAPGNLAPEATATPLPSASPTPSSPSRSR
jgi:hypothetical protein